ncbi:dynactin subunit 4, putative [Plasmodium malariae]|uniref:Dynactin subunit 4 n=1 Tax=Plasmodium malariae TaxID=5858 RepID=A0A1C3L1K3_PLAMA|nr:dynactin subunit 4, putative [Plasmodium malariae]
MKNKVYILLDDKLFKLKELYFCVICSKINNEFNLRNEIEYFYCNSCTQIYTKSESAVYSYECLRCFKCPFCFSCLTISQNLFDNSIKSILNIEHAKGSNYADQKDERSELNNMNALNYVKDENYTNDTCSVNSPPLDMCTYGYTIKDSAKKIVCKERNTLNDDSSHDTNSNVLEEERIMNSRFPKFFEKGKNIFYFKCPYCLWSSINTLYNTKLDELIGDMILIEKNCIFKCFFRNILNELIKSNEELKEKKVLKKTALNITMHKIENMSSFNEVHYFKKSTQSINNKENIGEFLGGREEANSSLICTSNIKIAYRSQADLDENKETWGGNTTQNIDHINGRDKNDNLNRAFKKNDEIEAVEKDETNRISKEVKANKMQDEDEINKTCKENEVNETCEGDHKMGKSKNRDISNLIIHIKNYLSTEHMHDYPYNFYKGISALKPLRTKLLSKNSKRCSTCKQYILKLHNSNLSSSFRLNNNAMKFLPRIYINDFRIIKKEHGVLNFILINPLGVEMNIKIIPKVEYNFLKKLDTNKIPKNCTSKSNSFEFVLDTYDEVIDDLLKNENTAIKTVIRSEYMIIKKQNNMALIIISFNYTDNHVLGKEYYKEEKEPSKINVQNDGNSCNNNCSSKNIFTCNDLSSNNNNDNDAIMDQKTKLNFPLTVECSFSDKSKKVHKLQLNLVFTNNISTKKFHHYSLND